MERHIYKELLEWKSSLHRKPLLIRGARQVGKTWLMKSFGSREYKRCVYLNFENNSRLKNIFLADLNIKRIIWALEIESQEKMDSDTLVIFDEIQEVPEALTSLKYFNEEAPWMHIMAAGSYLGIAMRPQHSFPVGKVDFLNLYPLSFIEFLNASGEGSMVELLTNPDWELVKAFKTKYIHLLKQYFYVGGMPEAVSRFVETKDFNEVRKIQNNILQTYGQDFSKHAPIQVIPRLHMVWNAIPSQLAKENRKFMYNKLKEGARAKEFEVALQWLTDTGLAHKVNRVNKLGLPLMAYEDDSAFKLYLLDVGLMAAMTGLDIKVFLEGNQAFEEFKGALAEQYVLQQLKTQKDTIVSYWAPENNSAEIDFLLQLHTQVIPLEVKASENLHAKSLRVYHQKYQPRISVRTSLSDYRNEGWLINIPLYAIGNINRYLYSDNKNDKLHFK